MPDEPAVWLGAALPDLAAMGRFRLEPHLVAAAPEALRVGIRLHHRSDAVFHRHGWFTTKLLHGRGRLEAAGLGRGPARAVAHVGPELLLDGALDPETTAALETVVDLLEGPWGQQATTVIGSRRELWSEHLERVRSLGLPSDNHDPVAVGQRLFRILALRPRLRLEQADQQAVLDLLYDLKPEIDASASDLLDEMTAGMGRT